MVFVEAKVMDAMHLELSKPISVTRGRTVFVVLAESSDHDSERKQWLEGSAASLRTAYGDSEPEYTAAMVRESNPDCGR